MPFLWHLLYSAAPPLNPNSPLRSLPRPPGLFPQEWESQIVCPIQTASAEAISVGHQMRVWSRACAFYPRLDMWFKGTVSFELVSCPGCFLVASSPPDTSDNPTMNLTIERLEYPRLRMRSQYNDDNQSTPGGGRPQSNPSLPLCADTFRRASFHLNDLDVVDSAGTGGGDGSGGATGTAAMVAQEAADLGDSGEGDDDLGAAADQIAQILRRWRERGVLLMDEVDLLLHPLKSELNFPIGKKVEIDVDVESPGAVGFSFAAESNNTMAGSTAKTGAKALPKGLRWDLPIAILDGILEADRRMSQELQSGADLHRDAPSVYVSGLVRCFKRGRAEKAIQTIPHLVLLDSSSDSGAGGRHKQPVARELLQLCAEFAIGWIESHQLMRYKMSNPPRQIATSVMLEYVLFPEGGMWPHKADFDRLLAPATLQILLLTRLWISCFVKHSLRKINRVNYGLLRGKQLAREAGNFFDNSSSKKRKKSGEGALESSVPPSRLLLALPFVGLEQPSESAEFAHPDVAIGLTILAYRHEGLRQEDLRVLIEKLKAELKQGAGPMEKRPEWILWKRWTDDAVELLRVPGGPQITADSLGLYPLDTFQLDEAASFQAAYALWQHFTPAIDHYLRKHVFPRVMRCQEQKISASGQALGSSLLFGSRLAFSGTPSDLLPREEDRNTQLFPCKFERGSEGKILSTLTDSVRVKARLAEEDWSVQGLLRHIAVAGTPGAAMPDRVDVLIDCGALVTGLSNQEVAQSLLNNGLSWAKGVVFLDDNDEKCVLLRSGGPDEAEQGRGSAAGSAGGTASEKEGRVVKLAQCGLAWHDRFAFYDQIHTTGMDIKNHDRARALITVGKDTTFRDFAQGAYRMRGLAKGKPQSLELLLVPEVRGLINKEIHDGLAKQRQFPAMFELPEESVRAVAAWLLLNQIRLESKQMLQLCVQNVDSVTRRRALKRLLAQPRMGSVQAAALLPLTAAFTEPVDVNLATEVPVPKTFTETLKERVATNALVCQPDAAGQSSIDEMLVLAAQATGEGDDANSAEAWKHRDLDAAQTRTQEREQELEKERQKQREIEREASPWKATSRDLSEPVPWLLADVVADRQDHPGAFYPLANFQLRSVPGDAGNTGKKRNAKGANTRLLVKLEGKAPRVFLSDNFAARRFTSPRARRLRALYTVLQYRLGSKSARSAVALSLQEAATVRRAIGESANSASPAFANLRLCCLPSCEVLVGAHWEQGGDRAKAAATVAAAGMLMSHAQAARRSGARSPQIQLLRYYDCQVDFEQNQGAALLSRLAAVAASARQQFFSTTVLSRRRDTTRWSGTAVAPYMQLESYEDLMGVRDLKRRIVQALVAHQMSPMDLAQKIDADHNQSISIDEFCAYLTTMEGMPPAQQIMKLKGPLLLVADQHMDGQISYEELALFLA